MKLFITTFLFSLAFSQSIVVPISKSAGSDFVGEFMLGANFQRTKLIIDTGSSEIVVTSDICMICSTKDYKPGNSKTTQNTGRMFQIDYQYDDVSVKVISFKDSVCINNYWTCIENFPFFAIYE